MYDARCRCSSYVPGTVGSACDSYYLYEYIVIVLNTSRTNHRRSNNGHVPARACTSFFSKVTADFSTVRPQGIFVQINALCIPGTWYIYISFEQCHIR